MERIKRKYLVKRRQGNTRKTIIRKQEKASVIAKQSASQVLMNGPTSHFFNISSTRTTTTLKKSIVVEIPVRRRVVVEIPIKRRKTAADAVLVVIPKFDQSDKTLTKGDEEGIIQLLTKYVVAKTEEQSQQKYYEYYLDDFIFYNAKGQPIELVEDLDCQVYFNGLLSAPDTLLPSIKCKKGIYTAFSIGGYGTDIQRPTIWIKSTVQEDTWYLLRNPSKEYIKAWRKFYWKVRFIKYIIDFIQEDPRRPFKDIQGVFYKWLWKTYNKDVSFKKWISDIKERDINFVVTANSSFLWSQALSLGEEFAQLPFFSDPCIVKKEFCRISTKLKWLEYTSVTPKAMIWFKSLFGRHMHRINLPDSHVAPGDIPTDDITQISEFDVDLVPSRIEWKDPLLIEEGIYNEIVYGGLSIKVGDIVELHRHEFTSWEPVGGRWIAQVTQLIKDKISGSFRMVWLYAPCQTIIGNVENYHPKELFYTTFCQCDDYQPITCIKRKCVVLFHKDTCPDIPHVYFCRYFYDHLNGCFWQLDQEEISNSKEVLVCGCAATENSVLRDTELYDVSQYKIGDTLLIQPARKSRQTLYKVCEVIRVDRRSNQLTIKYFVNARETYQKYKLNVTKPALNELYYYDKYDILDLKDFRKICGYCHVEYKNPQSPLPINLQHHGAGLQYFFSYQFEEEKNILLKVEGSIREIFLPYLEKNNGVKKLKVLDLFCGGGSFGRGLQDTGLFECKWAVDIDCMATYTYKVNAYGDNTVVFNQSVNLFLENCIDKKPCTPQKGEVDMILAGNPCQGYSSLNLNRYSDQSQNSNSLLANLASFIEFYEPKYVLLENVSNFPRVTEQINGKKHSPFKVFLAFLLDLGYQVRWSYISAVHHGCPQKRVRFFLWAAARGEELPNFPPSSHHGISSKYTQTSISLPSSERIPGVVDPMFACFPMRTVEETIGDLPPIGEGHVQHLEFPDHRVVPLPYEQQLLVNQIPLHPPGCDYRYLVGRRLPNGKTVVLPAWLTKKIERGTSLGTHFGRVEREGLFQTITTRCVPTGFQGKVLHYQENRVLSVREVARAQGFLDSDQIVGRPQDQYRIIGNSVPRSLGFALGIMLNYNRVKNPYHY